MIIHLFFAILDCNKIENSIYLKPKAYGWNGYKYNKKV